MTDHKNTFTRIECERCGAPLSKAKQRGKFICQYCGAVYYDRSYSKSEWEEFEDEHIPEKVEQPPEIKLAPTRKTKSSKVTLWLILGTTAFLCLIGLVVTVFSGSKSASILNGDSQVTKPEMLNALPEAENAGVSVPYADWELTFNPEISVDESKIRFMFTVKNWDDASQILRYQTKNFIVYDDQGNTYQLVIGRCEPDLPYQDRQLTFDPYEEMEFQSRNSWCNSASYLPEFFGVIPQNASKLYFHFKEFGVFKNITFIIDL
jgi:predicted RNA-binding Zn-ribbon protein involved in translation (DUF1610 family)